MSQAPKRSAFSAAKPAITLARDFCLETSMHGFRHVAEPRRHWCERLLWVMATALAAWGALHVSLGQLQRYNESPTVVTLEKDFRSWRFSLPAVTACMKNRTDPNKLVEVIRYTWDVGPSDEKYDYYSRFVDVVANSDLLHLEGYQEFAGDRDLDVDLYQLAVDVMPDLALDTKTSESVFLPWTPVMTEVGACYSVNSLAIDDVAIVKPDPNDTALFPITCKYGGKTSCNILMTSEMTSWDFYFHSPYDIMDITEPPSAVFPGYTRVMSVSVTETHCGRDVRALSPARRGCLFIDEPAKGRKVYSTNSCRLSCRNKVAISSRCRCRPFYYFYEEGPVCTPSGMACLAGIQKQLANNDGAKCSCSAQCLYSVFKEVSRDDKILGTGLFAKQGSMKYLVQPPKIRYTREIVFHFQDLVVSFGGAAGLFLGASFISFVEIVYFLLERLFRLVSNQETPVAPEENNTKKITFEEQRIFELTTILEHNLLSQEDHMRNTYF